MSDDDVIRIEDLPEADYDPPIIDVGEGDEATPCGRAGRDGYHHCPVCDTRISCGLLCCSKCNPNEAMARMMEANARRFRKSMGI